MRPAEDGPDVPTVAAAVGRSGVPAEGRSVDASGVAGESSPGTPLAGVRVVEFADGVAAAYCGKLLRDAGADVVQVEVGGARLGEPRTPLSHYLDGGKRSVDGSEPGLLERLFAWADIVVGEVAADGAFPGGIEVGALRAAQPRCVVVTLSAYGMTGPWAGRPGDDFTLQAWGGSTGRRGDAETGPLAVGGELTEWAAGVVAAVGALGVLLGVEAGKRGEHIDVAKLEVATLAFNSFMAVADQLAPAEARVAPGSPPRPYTEVPSVVRAADGWVGFATNTAAQFAAFAAMIGRPEWAEHPEYSRADRRGLHGARLGAVIDAWAGERTVAEIIALAGARNIPVAPVGNGRHTPGFDHMAARGSFVRHPGERFLRPGVPYRMSVSQTRPPTAAPERGADTAAVAGDLLRLQPGRPHRTPVPGSGPGGSESDRVVDAVADGPPPAAGVPHRPYASPDSTSAPAAVRQDLPGQTGAASSDARDGMARAAVWPLAGLRVFDFTSYWAGPCATQILGWFGADVVKVESVQRPDGTRMGSAYATVADRPWERAPLFHSVNTGKRGVTLDLTRPEGAALARRLLEHCDIFVENYSPRVVERFGLLPEPGERPDLIVARMPAWGLSGPWREQPGFAQNMEQAAGLAYITGHPDGRPVVPRGVCDPLGGLHAAFAILAAVRVRRDTGLGQHIEAPLLDAALSVTADQVLDWTASGTLIERTGNRSATAAPRGVYRCGPNGAYIALSVRDDADWRHLTDALGHPAWAAPAELATPAQRLRDHDRLDTWLHDILAEASPPETVERLTTHGVPAAEVVPAERVHANPQLAARAFFQQVTHPVTGLVGIPIFPARWANGTEPHHRSPAPQLGEHNREVLTGLLGLSAAELAGLTQSGVIGTRPAAR